jgi:hypothetical protein
MIEMKEMDKKRGMQWSEVKVIHNLWEGGGGVSGENNH